MKLSTNSWVLQNNYPIMAAASNDLFAHDIEKYN